MTLGLKVIAAGCAPPRLCIFTPLLHIHIQLGQGLNGVSERSQLKSQDGQSNQARSFRSGV
jgi:hypothetical protein